MRRPSLARGSTRESHQPTRPLGASRACAARFSRSPPAVARWRRRWWARWVAASAPRRRCSRPAPACSPRRRACAARPARPPGPRGARPGGRSAPAARRAPCADRRSPPLCGALSALPPCGAVGLAAIPGQTAEPARQTDSASTTPRATSRHEAAPFFDSPRRRAASEAWRHLMPYRRRPPPRPPPPREGVAR